MRARVFVHALVHARLCLCKQGKEEREREREREREGEREKERERESDIALRGSVESDVLATRKRGSRRMNPRFVYPNTEPGPHSNLLRLSCGV